jgi:hypothetical protein
MVESTNPFDWSAIAAGDEHYALALDAYHTGRSFPEIVAMLEQGGLSPELIPEVTTALAKDRAAYLFSQGKSASEVRDVLVERGLGQQDADYIARTVATSRERGYASLGIAKWQTRSLVAGGVLLTVGIVLYILRRFAGLDLPVEVITGLLGSGVLLGGIGGVYVAFRATKPLCRTRR